MPFTGRVFRFGKWLVIAGALGGTFVLFAAIGMRAALRSREVSVPALKNRSIPEATRALDALGLTIRVDDVRRPDPTIPQGRVVQQEPLPGAAARRQRTVRVWVSAGPRVTTVATLVGESERAARLRLTQDGVVVASVAELRSSDYPVDTVVAQDPPGSVNATRVTLLVNRGAERPGYLMPDLTGLDVIRTAEALRQLGFRVNISGPGANAPTSGIAQHTPEAGAHLRPSDVISLEASR